MERTEEQTVCVLEIGYLQKNDEVRMDRVIRHKTQSPEELVLWHIRVWKGSESITISPYM